MHHGLTTALALAVAGFDLGRRHLPRPLARLFTDGTAPLFDRLEALHSGLVADYVTWLLVSLALFAVAFALV